jgi:ribosomal protein S18 acetylase RimI-like enzyme
MNAVVERLADLPLDRVAPLLTESEQAGLPLVRRLVDDWASGHNRFDRSGEMLFAATVDGRWAGVCGLNVDPYAATPGVGRVRHLYVLTADRRAGIGRRLLDAVVAGARDAFHTLRLRTHNPVAARLYERAGFERVGDVPDCTHRLRLR